MPLPPAAALFCRWWSMPAAHADLAHSPLALCPMCHRTGVTKSYFRRIIVGLKNILRQRQIVCKLIRKSDFLNWKATLLRLLKSQSNISLKVNYSSRMGLQQSKSIFKETVGKLPSDLGTFLRHGTS
jgi:hypothetical protein